MLLLLYEISSIRVNNHQQDITTDKDRTNTLIKTPFTTQYLEISAL